MFPQAASSGTAEVDLGYSSKVQMFGIESISALSLDMQQDSELICKVRLVHEVLQLLSTCSLLHIRLQNKPLNG